MFLLELEKHSTTSFWPSGFSTRNWVPGENRRTMCFLGISRLTYTYVFMCLFVCLLDMWHTRTHARSQVRAGIPSVGEVEVRRQLAEVGSFLPPCGSWDCPWAVKPGEPPTFLFLCWCSPSAILLPQPPEASYYVSSFQDLFSSSFSSKYLTVACPIIDLFVFIIPLASVVPLHL